MTLNNPAVLFSGTVPQPPYIIVKDESIRQKLMHELHKDWARVPQIDVAEEWPKDYTVNALVVTPLHVIGSEQFQSFSIEADISDSARKALNALISLKKAHSGGNITYRDIALTLGWNRRTVTNALKELEKAGVGVIRDRNGFSIDIGTWIPDAEKAKAFGINIKTY